MGVSIQPTSVSIRTPAETHVRPAQPRWQYKVLKNLEIGSHWVAAFFTAGTNIALTTTVPTIIIGSYYRSDSALAVAANMYTGFIYCLSGTVIFTIFSKYTQQCAVAYDARPVAVASIESIKWSVDTCRYTSHITGINSIANCLFGLASLVTSMATILLIETGNCKNESVCRTTVGAASSLGIYCLGVGLLINGVCLITSVFYAYLGMELSNAERRENLPYRSA